jgi:putative SOS response-associated peptidase YedK
MCGRFTQVGPSEAYAELFGVEDNRLGNLAPRYNVAPTQTTWACTIGQDGERHLDILRWGLVPHWSKGPDSKYSMINARAETVHRKPAYRDAFRHRRCLIPAEGFYEWKPLHKGKQPYYIHRKDGQTMAFAGLWERWKDRESGEVINSCTIIVTDANELMRPIHDRMPVIVPPDDFERWLETGAGEALDLLALLRPAASDGLEAYCVSKAVNSPKNEGRELIDRIAPDAG